MVVEGWSVMGRLGGERPDRRTDKHESRQGLNHPRVQAHDM